MEAIRSLTLGDVLAEHARRHPDQVAVVCNDERFTYPQLDERVTRLADSLRRAGVAAGDRVLWVGQNSHRVIELLLASGRLGAMFCPVNWRQSAIEAAFVIDDLRPAVVIWQQEEVGETMVEARRLAEHQAEWYCHDAAGEGSYEALLAAGDGDATFDEVDPDSPVLVIYTAAFGGRPNGALLTHTNLLTQSLVLAIMQDVTAETVYLACGPLFHVATWMTTIPTFHFGGKLVISPRVDAEELCRLIDAERCTRGFVVGPTVAQIVELNTEGRFDLSSFRSTWPNEAWAAMTSPDTSPWGVKPGGWGQTEVMALATFASAAGANGSLTRGRTSPMALVRVVDGSDRELPPGESGELIVRGPTVGHGYWNRPELNEQRMRGGWWHTADLGRLETDGTITFLGTMERMIKSAAENIYPAEVEACIESHPAVAEAAVIGVPDPKWTQSVKAIVVRKPGHDVDEAGIIEHCRASIASYKKPRSVEFVEGPLPRIGPAKDHATLDERHGGGGYPGSITTR